MEDFTHESLVIATNSEFPREVYIYITRIGRVITIWDEVFLKFRVYFDGMVRRKKVFYYSIHLIETYLDVVVEVLEVQRSVYFEVCLDEEYMEFC